MTGTTGTPPRRATINDVAAAAGVSRQTVSNVVNRPERVADGTRARVEEVIARLRYRPSSAAQSLRHQRAGAVGLEVDTLGAGNRSEVVYPFLVELSLAARDHDCHIVTFGSDADSPSLTGYETMVRARLVDAFVLADTHHGDPRPAYLASAGIPYAAFGRIWDDPGDPRWADVDGRAGTAAAVRHLLDEGYERIGFLGWPAGSPTGDDRREGWRATLAEAGRLDPALQAETTQDLETARHAARDLVTRVGRGGAVVVVSDVVALGVLQAAYDLGLRGPEDLGITGFDGSSLAALHEITTLEQPLDRVAQHLLGVVEDALAGRPAPEQGLLVPPTLTVRRSSRRTAGAASAAPTHPPTHQSAH